MKNESIKINLEKKGILALKEEIESHIDLIEKAKKAFPRSAYTQGRLDVYQELNEKLGELLK